MPLYPYTADDGETFDVFASMVEAPPIGHEIERDGKVFRRAIVKPTKPVIPEYRFKSVQVEPYHPAAPYHDDEGQACFTSKEEVREFCRATAGEAKSENDLVWRMEGRARDGIKRSCSTAADRDG